MDTKSESNDKNKDKIDEKMVENKVESDSSKKEDLNFSEEKDEISEVKNKVKEKIKDKPSKPKKETDKPKDKDKKDQKDDFKYIVRIANTDIDGEKTLERGLTSIKGIGMHMSTLVIDSSGMNRKLKMGNLTDMQIEKIQDSLDKITKTAPNWMLNHQKDSETGEDTHFIGTEIEMRLRDEINIMKKIRSYRGIRHERGLPVRGQRTRANNRKGLSLGVSKKGAQQK